MPFAVLESQNWEGSPTTGTWKTALISARKHTQHLRQTTMHNTMHNSIQKTIAASTRGNIKWHFNIDKPSWCSNYQKLSGYVSYADKNYCRMKLRLSLTRAIMCSSRTSRKAYNQRVFIFGSLVLHFHLHMFWLGPSFHILSNTIQQHVQILSRSTLRSHQKPEQESWNIYLLQRDTCTEHYLPPELWQALLTMLLPQLVEGCVQRVTRHAPRIPARIWEWI